MKRSPGRPPIDERETPARVHVTVSSNDYDRAYVIAQREGVKVPELLRRGLARVIADDEDDD